jgi:hypothetical protein
MQKNDFRGIQTLHTSFVASIAALLLMAGCAATKVEITGSPLQEPLCEAGKPPTSVLVYWGNQWRADQKEPQLREAAAQRGLQDFLSRAGCLSVVAVNRVAAGQDLPSNDELVRLAARWQPVPERVLLVVVRELGPKLAVGIPVIVEGGTEVLIDVRVLDPKAAKPLATVQTLWRNGGTFVVKGVKTLDQDMSEALNATLMKPRDAQ